MQNITISENNQSKGKRSEMIAKGFAIFWFPALLVIIMWVSFWLNQEFNLHYERYGIAPRNYVGLRGIFLSPFIHGDLNHLYSNTIPIFILGGLLQYFYPKLMFRVILISIIAGGFWVWVAARPAVHIGMSGLVYALSFFLIISGFLRGNKRLLAISLLVTFLYGSLVWGMLPIVPQISFEGHFFGALAGLVLAITYRKNEVGIEHLPEKVVHQPNDEIPLWYLEAEALLKARLAAEQAEQLNASEITDTPSTENSEGNQNISPTENEPKPNPWISSSWKPYRYE